MNRHYQSKIEKSGRYGKALCVTCFLFLFNGSCSWTTAAERSVAHDDDGISAMICFGGDLRERGPRAAAMGGCAAAISGGAETALFNPAMLAGSEDGGILFWTPSRFGMTELGAAAGVWSQTFSGFNTAVSLQRFGFELYSEHRLDVSAALPVGGAIAAGARISALHINIARYGNTIIPIIDFGVRCRVADGLEAAAVGFALNMPSIADEERLPAGISAGLAWQHDGLLLALDCEKESRSDVNLRLGTEYRLLPEFAIRFGAATLTRQWTAGFAVGHGAFRVEYALSVHSELGASHTVGIGFEP
ncbi:MAG: hypothetical protein WBQ23_02890 [Bacteroidota bacterium]